MVVLCLILSVLCLVLWAVLRAQAVWSNRRGKSAAPVLLIGVLFALAAGLGYAVARGWIGEQLLLSGFFPALSLLFFAIGAKLTVPALRMRKQAAAGSSWALEGLPPQTAEGTSAPEPPPLPSKKDIGTQLRAGIAFLCAGLMLAGMAAGVLSGVFVLVNA